MSNNFDVVIIGGGLAGLVCGAILSKEGMKVLLVEKNKTVGGYCASFSRKNFFFDACVHSLGGLREGGTVNKVFSEIGILDKLAVTRPNLLDTIISRDYNICYWKQIDKTIDAFCDAFPKEAKQIKLFFDFVNTASVSSRFILGKKSLKNLLDEYFSDYRLKAIISFPLYVNTGLSPCRLSAFLAIAVYKESILDGGYYPKKGMQAVPDSLMEKFEEFGGKVVLSTTVKKIAIKNNQVTGVFLGKKNFVTSRYVISAGDLRGFMFDIIRDSQVFGSLKKRLMKLKPSLSMFVVYLGLKKDFVFPFNSSNIWLLTSYDLEKMHDSANRSGAGITNNFLLRKMPMGNGLCAFMNTSFKNLDFWKKNKAFVLNNFLHRLSIFSPEISENIIFKDAATPSTLQRYTLNFKGSAYGWSNFVPSILTSSKCENDEVRDLYFTGHWATFGHGLPGAVYSGFNTAKTISSNRDKNI
jgi:phytoene dehydrogenase-like protein